MLGFPLPGSAGRSPGGRGGRGGRSCVACVRRGGSVGSRVGSSMAAANEPHLGGGRAL
ncbi:hypothetical protein EYF80_067029 [Liparis tanakae]|uniref:Uncharacterized protein n=1 Tax=Liparis tanakae TaxID=230148 RepID=A0A4Z2E253_9TELE|nr:hypothetical protein EYF80_067029 [Liparis tanakae]